MSSTGSRERSDQIPARGCGMTAYQKEKSKAPPHQRPPTASTTCRSQGQQRKVGAKGMKNKFKKIELIMEGLLQA